MVEFITNAEINANFSPVNAVCEEYRVRHCKKCVCRDHYFVSGPIGSIWLSIWYFLKWQQHFKCVCKIPILI